MSRGFVKEDDQEEIPMVPPRADLPEGLTNYVTQTGLDELLREKESLVNERDTLDHANDKERRIAFNHINAKLDLLNSRIVSARVVPLDEQPKDEVRFGAKITLKVDKKLQTYQIVGADEADIGKGKISIISPIAKILINKKNGDKAVLKLSRGERVFEVMNIEYS